MVGTMRPIVLSFLFFATSAFAQQADPTRPPANWLQSVDTSGNAAGDGGSASLRLQSILMPQGGKPVAVIGGRTVALGGRIGGATLVRLNEHEAVLQGADGVTHLYLTPDVQKQMIVTPAPRKTGKTGQMKGLP